MNRDRLLSEDGQEDHDPGQGHHRPVEEGIAEGGPVLAGGDVVDPSYEQEKRGKEVGFPR